MIRLNLPDYNPRLTKKKTKLYIYDFLRRKNVVLTPEEWVRQHFVNYLVNTKQYPLEYIANEVSIKLNDTSKRCDTIVYDKFLNPIVIIEYKAPNIAINQDVLSQIIRYDYAVMAPYLIISNGLSHYCCLINFKEFNYTFLKEIPNYNDLIV